MWTIGKILSGATGVVLAAACLLTACAGLALIAHTVWLVLTKWNH